MNKYTSPHGYPHTISHRLSKRIFFNTTDDDSHNIFLSSHSPQSTHTRLPFIQPFSPITKKKAVTTTHKTTMLQKFAQPQQTFYKELADTYMNWSKDRTTHLIKCIINDNKKYENKLKNEFIEIAKKTLGGIYQQIMGIPNGAKMNNNFMEFMQSLYGDMDESKLRTDHIKYVESLRVVKRIKMKDARRSSTDLFIK